MQDQATVYSRQGHEAYPFWVKQDVLIRASNFCSSPPTMSIASHFLWPYSYHGQPSKTFQIGKIEKER